MTDQLNLLPEEPVNQPKKRGPYKKRQAPPKPEKAMAKLELKTALLNGLFETAYKGPENRFNSEKTEKATEKATLLDKNHPSRLQLKEIRGVYDYKEGATGEVFPNAIILRLKVPVLMGIQAETILLSLLHLASKQEILTLVQPLVIESVNGNMQSALPSSAKGAAKEKPKGEIITTKSELLRIAAMGDSKRAYDLLETCLEQMSDMKVYFQNTHTGWSGSDNFLRFLSHKDGRLKVDLNWRLTGAILGEYFHANIDLNERHLLNRDNTKTLHRWLSGHVWEGKTNHLKYSTLARHVWSTETTELAQKKREQRVRLELLKEIDNLDCWSVEFLKDSAKITRLKKAKIRQAN